MSASASVETGCTGISSPANIQTVISNPGGQHEICFVGGEEDRHAPPHVSDLLLIMDTVVVCARASTDSTATCRAPQACPSDDSSVYRHWWMTDLPPLTIPSDTAVVMDCKGKSFNYHSKYGNLTVGAGSSIEYMNCDLLEYEFPDHPGLYDTLHIITDCWVGMSSCTVCSPASSQLLCFTAYST